VPWHLNLTYGQGSPAKLGEGERPLPPSPCFTWGGGRGLSP